MTEDNVMFTVCGEEAGTLGQNQPDNLYCVYPPSICVSSVGTRNSSMNDPFMSGSVIFFFFEVELIIYPAKSSILHPLCSGPVMTLSKKTHKKCLY